MQGSNCCYAETHYHPNPNPIQLPLLPNNNNVTEQWNENDLKFIHTKCFIVFGITYTVKTAARSTHSHRTTTATALQTAEFGKLLAEKDSFSNKWLEPEERFLSADSDL